MRKTLIQALALSLPMLVFFAEYVFNHPPDLIPTGFIQYDNVSYVAYGKQYLDEGKSSLFYSNPFNDHNQYEPIYFQTQSLFFAFLLKIGVPPGWILIPFTIICSLICFVLLIKIYDFLVKDKSYRVFHLWLFAWGGGLLVVASILAHYTMNSTRPLVDDLFLVDPEGGWWGLNLGRALFFSCEAYYHALFLGCIYTLLKKNWLPAAVLLFLLSISHPFTGLELAGIVCLWCVVEFVVNRREMPVWFGLAAFLVLAFHLFYYLVYLEQFPDHRSVSEQYTLRWRLGIYRIIPAYALVGGMAIASVYFAGIRKFLAIRSNRIFLCWFIVAFLLANHEVFMKARQPIHFTRGYIWTSLFLLGLPALQYFNKYLHRKAGLAGLILLAIVFFTDNALWIRKHFTQPAGPYANYITHEQEEILKTLDQFCTNQTLIVSNDNTVAYLSAVYTKAYPWYSHLYTTPFSEKKRHIQQQFFKEGVIDTSWQRREIHFILNKTDSTAIKSLNSLAAKKMFETTRYLVMRYQPAASGAN